MRQIPFPILRTALVIALGTVPVLAQVPAGWNNPQLANATYVILEPRIEGNPNLVNDEQRASILKAMRGDTAGALKRRYPNAQIVPSHADSAIKVTPVLKTPAALLHWAKLGARLEMQLPSGERVTVADEFSLMTLWQQGWNAANYAIDQLARQMP